MAGSTYTPIATTTLASAVTSYTFTSIPATYTDLVLIFNGTTSATDAISLQFNSDTATNYSSTSMAFAATAGISQRQSTVANINISGLQQSMNSTGPGMSIVNIMNYANTTMYKSVLAKYTVWQTTTNGGGGYNTATWRSTTAITSIKCQTSSGNNFAIGSTFTLYGIQAA
jgi:hypothetical protein